MKTKKAPKKALKKAPKKAAKKASKAAKKAKPAPVFAKKPKLTAAMPAAATRCELAGPPVGGGVVRLSPGAASGLRVMVCKTQARVRVELRRDLGAPEILFDDVVLDDEVIAVPGLSAGRHMLFWMFQTPAADWQSVSELSASAGTVQYRRFRVH